MNRFGWALFLGLMAGVTGCDHATKQLAASELRSGPVSVVPHVLELRVVHNTDSAFNLLGGVLPPGARWALLSVLTALITLGAFALVARRFKMLHPVTRVGAALVIGGALGNLSDRLLRGHVIDFIHIRHWPVFNVADIAVVLGVVLLLARLERRPRPTARGP